MSLLAEMTLVHMEASTAIDRIDRGLLRMKRQAEEPEESRREIDRLISVSLRVREKMDRFFQREQRELFPLARRILGEEGSDLRRLARARSAFLDAIDHFIVALSETLENGEGAVTQRLDYLDRLYSDVVERYDEHCDAQRSFFQVHSTILFPGGVATE
jgi:hypothetical protein